MCSCSTVRLTEDVREFHFSNIRTQHGCEAVRLITALSWQIKVKLGFIFKDWIHQISLSCCQLSLVADCGNGTHLFGVYALGGQVITISSSNQTIPRGSGGLHSNRTSLHNIKLRGVSSCSEQRENVHTLRSFLGDVYRIGLYEKWQKYLLNKTRPHIWTKLQKRSDTDEPKPSSDEQFWWTSNGSY